MIALSKFPTSIRPKYPKAPLEVSEDTRLTPVSDDISVPDLEVEVQKVTDMCIGGDSDTEPSDDDRFHQKILPIITILRCFGFISFTLPVEHRFWHKAKLYLLHSFYLFIAFSFLLLNVLIFTFNMYIVKISTYTFLNNRYARLKVADPLLTDTNDGYFNDYYLVSAKLILIVVSIVSFSIPALIRAGQYVIMGSQLGEHLLDDVSLVLVPILSVWQLLPLFYFIIVSDMLRKWFKDVAMVLKSDRRCDEHNIRFYYKLYLKLTYCSETLGVFLNPFFFFTLGISILILGLTLYFIGNSDSALSLPPDADFEYQALTIFFILWAGLQVVAAVILILGICCAGIRLNEQARAILPIVLSVITRDDKSRFQVICFSQKVQLHFMWSISVWKTFPIERGLLFTIVGLVSSYALVLLRLQAPLQLHLFEDSRNGTHMVGKR